MQTSTNTAITPFSVNIPQDQLDDLRHRLASTRFVQDLPDVGWTYGTPTAYLQDLTTWWMNDYDWRKWEATLNGYPQFTTSIDGEDIHFLHIESAEPDATPLVLLHGWPGSIVEFLHVIEPLTNPVRHGGRAEDAFHLVIPSLPGFGFSGPTRQTGWNTNRVAKAIAELMSRLGYERYGAQGGDFGAFVASDLGKVDSEHVIGIHVNAATFGFIPFHELDDSELASLTDLERARVARMKAFLSVGNAYFQIQATRPQTIAAGLADSPVGQLAWIVDKFHAWTYREEGSDEIPIERDIMITDVMLYWMTNTSSSSARMYYENMHGQAWGPPSQTPTGVAVFAEDIAIRRYAEQANNIVHWSDFERGGHFAALEAPDLLFEDIRTFFGTLRFAESVSG